MNELDTPEYPDELPDEILEDEITESAIAGSASWYVNPVEMLEAYKIEKAKRDIAIANGADYYPISPYLADCIVKISNHLSYRYNFINYSWRQDMVSDGIENCVRGFWSFDPERSPYIFAYYTRTCFYAFVRRIQKEEYQSELKGEIIYSMDVDSIITQAQDSGEFDESFIGYMKETQDFKRREDKPKAEKPAKKPKNPLPELFFDGDESEEATAND